MRKLLMAVCLVLPAAAFAQADPCLSQSTTADMNSCAKTEFDKDEKTLNDTYQQLLKQITKPDQDGVRYGEVKKKLIEAQRAWVTFRKKDCDAVYTYNESGTIRTLEFLGCMRAHTVQRTKELSGFIVEK
ncbi:lysozyme inhibitor LprI family protein [Collimonas sp. NPDC087041]|uniref:lysozyme inhibitor LprI family protein n=1 Tax=Collimonas sp. NPDC087041 TaxID=3363960 RepID=UPI00380A57DB